MRTLPAIASCVLTGAFGLTACASSVAIEPATTDEATVKLCSNFVGALPVTLDGARRANTDPKSPTTAAWGPPFITLRCGVPVPAAYSPTAQVVTINGVDWLPEQLDHGVMFTTIGRSANVEITVPQEYRPEAGAATEVSQIVNDELPALPH